MQLCVPETQTYKLFADDIYTKRNKNQGDILFKNLNNFHPNISLTIEVNPKKFLDTKEQPPLSFIKKETKLPIPWILKSCKHYK